MRQGRALRIAFAGGGTGGHIVPGLHLVASAREAGRPFADVVWFTSGRAVEERALVDAPRHLGATPLERVRLEMEPPGGGAPSRSRLVVRTPGAVMQARRALVAHRSDVLLGLGGFTSLPAVLAARSLAIPVALLEINAHEGAATRWLSRFSARVLHAWSTTMPRGGDGANPASRAHRLVGPPLAPEFFAGTRDRASRRAARAGLGFDPDLPLLVVLGGSQGSSALNTFVRAQARALVAGGVQVLHQTGPGKLGEADEAFTGYRALEYVSPMQPALLAATVCLCRGGASTLAEVAAMRVPAFVAPYPGHADRHQESNARALGAGIRVVQDHELSFATRDAILHLANDAGRARREAMSAHLAEVVPADAAVRILDELGALVVHGPLVSFPTTRNPPAPDPIGRGRS